MACLASISHRRRMSYKLNVQNMSDMTDKCPLTSQNIAPSFLLAHGFQQTLRHKDLKITLYRFGG
jgi:hypothetical protein